MKERTIQLALVDDHRLFREGLNFMISRMEGINMLYDVENGYQLLEKLRTDIPDILLLDLDMPEFDGIQVFKEIKPLYPWLKVIVLTTHKDTKMIAYLMELGANSYLLKDAEPDILYRAIESVYHEGYYFTRDVSRSMVTGLKSTARKKPVLKNNVTLSPREIEVLELICREFTAKEIAEKLFISPRTAEGHRRHLIEKLGVKNTAGLIVKAIKEGLIRL